MPRKPTASKPVTKEILLADITADMGINARVDLSEEVIADYGSAMLEGAKFPASVIYDDGTTKWLADGFHRFTAASRTNGKIPYLLCEIRQGSKRDAIPVCARRQCPSWPTPLAGGQAQGRLPHAARPRVAGMGRS
jgi:hypothetical protein